jgi:hypothetical protein
VLVYVLYAAVVLAVRLPRCRLAMTPGEGFAVRLASATLVTANWMYLIVSGR